MIFRGVGGDWHPHVPHLDKLMTDRLKLRGFKGSREIGKSHFGSTILDQALSFTTNDDFGKIRVLVPENGSTVGWTEGVVDAVISFQMHLRDLFWNRVERYNGIVFRSLVVDIAGDINTLETYLHLNRQRRAISAIVDKYLDEHTVREVVINSEQSLESILEGHKGEVWITGPCRVEAYDANLHAEFPWLRAEQAVP